MLYKEQIQPSLVKWELLLKRGNEDFSLKTFRGGHGEYRKNRGGGFPGCVGEPHRGLCRFSEFCLMGLLDLNPLEGSGIDG